jgi:hypothetical protein
VVCVGGSAGGLDAYVRLLRHLPADLGVAVVIVNHVRNVATLLHEVLPRFTSMPVELITERLLIQPDRVFIIRSSGTCGEFGSGPSSPGLADRSSSAVADQPLARQAHRRHRLRVRRRWIGGAARIKQVRASPSRRRPGRPAGPACPKRHHRRCIDLVLSPEGIALEIAAIAGADPRAGP